MLSALCSLLSALRYLPSAACGTDPPQTGPSRAAAAERPHHSDRRCGICFGSARGDAATLEPLRAYLRVLSPLSIAYLLKIHYVPYVPTLEFKSQGGRSAAGDA
jgi:hypothetical protein